MEIYIHFKHVFPTIADIQLVENIILEAASSPNSSAFQVDPMPVILCVSSCWSILPSLSPGSLTYLDPITQPSSPAGFWLGSTSERSSQETGGQQEGQAGVFLPLLPPYL